MSEDETARRALQRALNQFIGDKNATVMTAPEVLTLDQMMRRCVYATRTGAVVVLPLPGDDRRASVFPLAKFKEAYRASVDHGDDGEDGEDEGGGGGGTGGGGTKVTTLWGDSRRRHTVASVAMAIGRPRFFQDDTGHPAVNLWTPRFRTAPARFDELVKPFLEHVEFLVPVAEEREAFLNWLAHAEQCPEVLPHHGYLMYTETFGIGRNWLASVLTRVWSGEVAASLDLSAMLRGRFNDRIGGKRLAIMDEIHVNDSGQSSHSIASKLRELMTQETRTINAKHKAEYTEFNVLRWLMFGQDAGCLPLPAGDRRVTVIKNPTTVRPPEYYQRIYKLLPDPAFIQAVGWFLHTRPIDRFNPGAPPVLNAAKVAVIEASKTAMDRAVEALMEYLPGARLMLSEDLMMLLAIDPTNNSATKNFGHSMRRAGWMLYPTPRGRVQISGRPRVCWVPREGPLVEKPDVQAAIEECRATYSAMKKGDAWGLL